MKKLKTITLMALVLAGGLASCKKDSNQGPDAGNGQLTNSAQIFLNDNTGFNLESNESVKSTYADNKLSVNFTQDGTDFSLVLPNYDLSAAPATYTNANMNMVIKRGNKTYLSSNVFIPAIVGNPPHPVFVTDKVITVNTSNLRVDDNTTDVSIQIVSGSEIITAPISNGQAPVYESLAFKQGDGGKPNMVMLRIKH